LNYVYVKAGLVHRDIKPENILIQRFEGVTDLFPESDEAKLIDFGLVKSANDDEHLTQTGMTIGTPLYMSPEQVRGDKLDCRSDIYGLGATIFHLLTGSPPFKGTSPGAIMSAHLTDPVPDPGELVPSLSAETRRLVTTAMAKKESDRYLNFDAFVKACDSAINVASERSGGALKLLRKPLVINKKATAKPSPAPIPAKPEVVALPDISSSAPPQSDDDDLSERIQRKNAELKQKKNPGTAKAEKPGSHRALPVENSTPGTGTASHAPTSASAENMATDALIKAQTDRIRKKKELPKTPIVPEVDLSRSAVFVEDSERSGGTGIFPWIFLALAIGLAIAYLVYRLRAF
jgi:serine/threonine protein kinase